MVRRKKRNGKNGKDFGLYAGYVTANVMNDLGYVRAMQLFEQGAPADLTFGAFTGRTQNHEKTSLKYAAKLKVGRNLFGKIRLFSWGNKSVSFFGR